MPCFNGAVVASSIPVEAPAAPRGSGVGAPHVAALTGLRGMAALLVVTIHTAGMTPYPWLGIPDYGPVSLFVLSGFLLYRPWARWALGAGARPEIGTFVKRRVTRLFPAYLLVFLCVLAVFPPARPADAQGWLMGLSLTGIYAPDGLVPAFLHTWSLGTELSWYVALPVFGLVTGTVVSWYSREWRPWIIAGMIALAVPTTVLWRGWVELTGGGGFTRALWLPSYLLCFAAGALVAHAIEAERAGRLGLRRLRDAASDPWLLPVLALAVVLVGTSTLGGPAGWVDTSFAQHQVRFLAATGVAVIMLLIAALGRAAAPTHRLLTTRPSVAIGRWSYGIYLWHLPLIFILAEHLDPARGVGGTVLWFALVLGITIPLSAATYRWVERPVIAWAKRERRQPVPADAYVDRRLGVATREGDRPAAHATPATSAHAAQPSSTATLSVHPAE